MNDACLSEKGAAVTACAFPALLLHVPSERVLAASPTACALLSPDGAPLIGRPLEDFLGDEPSGALPLLMCGRLTGFETSRQVAVTAEPLTMWLRRVDETPEPEHVVAILARADPDRPRLLLEPPAGHGHVVVGSADPDLVVDRVSSDVEDVLGIGPELVIGRSLLRLVADSSRAPLLWGLAQSTSHGSGIPLHLDIVGVQGQLVPVQVLIVPLDPPASCAFSILPRLSAGAGPTDGQIHAMLGQFAAGIDALDAARQLVRLSDDASLLSRLSVRELEIVTRLVGGSRVPAIAKALFLSQSTVRNHLSSVFTKLRVASQQELLDLFVRTDTPSSPS